jgi:transposase
MRTPLSLDLRTRIADAVAAGAPVRAVAQRFAVSVASAVRLGQKRRAGASLSPGRPGKPRPARITGEIAAWLRARLTEKPDLTMRALAAELRARGTPVSHDTVWRFVRRQGLTVKKRCWSPASKTGRRSPGSARAGGRTSPASILNAWCSSTRPGSEPT